MKLKNKLRHMANSSVKVNGNVYQIDKDGYATVDNEADSAKLLNNYQAWKEVHGDVDTDTDVDTKTDKEVPDTKGDTGTDTGTDTDIDTDTDTDTDVDGDSDANVDDIPDPSEEMSLKELRELADTYQVSYNKKATKAVLVDLITKAMYPDD